MSPLPRSFVPRRSNPVPQLEGMPSSLWGASYEKADNNNTVGARWTDRFVARNRMGTLTNNALSGSGADSMAIRILGNTATKSVSGAKTLNILSPLQNSLFWGGYTSAKAIASIQNNVHAALCGLSSISRVESSTLAATGTWSTDTQTSWSAGSAMLSSEDNAYLEGSLTFPASGILDVVIATVDTASAIGIAFPPAPYSMSVDGIVQKQGTAADGVLDTASTVENTGVGRKAVRLTATPGAHTVRITKLAGTGTTYLYVDTILARGTAQTSPLVMLVKAPPLNWAAVHALGYTVTMTDAELAAANAYLELEAGVFPNVYIMDPTLGWSYQSMIGTADNLHPDDHGEAQYADAADTTAIDFPWTAALHTGL